MAVLTWSDALALQQPRMDLTHREFVDLLAALELALDGSVADVDDALGRLVEHTEAHFAQEERWMVALGFAPGNCHAFQHAHVLQVLHEVDTLWRNEGDLALVRQIVTELGKWFPAHAQTMDAALAQVMAELGFDPERGTLERQPAAAHAPITGCGSAGCG